MPIQIIFPVAGRCNGPEAQTGVLATNGNHGEVLEVGVVFATPTVYAPVPQAVGPQIHTPWNNPPFDLMPIAPGQALPTDMLHASVKARWNADNTYRPMAMAAFSTPGLAAWKTDNASYV